jgi:hypothetical protein
MFNKLNKGFFFAVFTVFFVYGCANIGSITGGDKDITPPKIVESKPANRAINFSGKRITISFDEFIQLKDISKNFVISPPMKKAPVIVPKPKDIIVNFEDDLLPNTTYTLYFGNSVVDNNEGNPFRNFNFVFSTGSYIDSLSFLGRISNAFDRTPLKDGMFVMLYPINHDTIPRKTLPAFITKSNDKGWFKFDNIYADTFLIFGLKDANMNYLFDQPNEIIAFSDTMVVIDSSNFEVPDTAITKKIVLKDSIPPDSIDEYAGRTPKVELFAFTEEHFRKQNLNDYKRPKNNRFILIFERPIPDDSLFIDLIDVKANNKWYIKENLLLNDTLEYWITDTSIIKTDSLKFRIGYYTVDSMNALYLAYDTISMNFKRPPGAKNKKTQQKTVFPKVSFQSAVSSNSTLDLNGKFYIDTDQPIKSINLKKILIYKMEDSLKIPVKFTLQKDSVYLRRYYLNFPIESDYSYITILDTASFNSIYGINNDSTGYSFKTQRDDYYGTIKLTLKNIRCPILVQLITLKGEVLNQQRVRKDGLVNFDYLAPGKYGIKVIYDKNDNGQWDTGNWGRKLLPERVYFYSKEIISVRSNWEMEIIWELP